MKFTCTCRFFFMYEKIFLHVRENNFSCTRKFLSTYMEIFFLPDEKKSILPFGNNLLYNNVKEL